MLRLMSMRKYRISILYTNTIVYRQSAIGYNVYNAMRIYAIIGSIYSRIYSSHMLVCSTSTCIYCTTSTRTQYSILILYSTGSPGCTVVYQ